MGTQNTTSLTAMLVAGVALAIGRYLGLEDGLAETVAFVVVGLGTFYLPEDLKQSLTDTWKEWVHG